MNVHELTWTEDRDLSDRMNEEIHSGKRDRIGYEKRYRRALTASPVWVQATVSAVRDDAGKWLRSITTIEAITRAKKPSIRSPGAPAASSFSLTAPLACSLRIAPSAAIGQLFDNLAEHLGLEMYFNYLLTEDGKRPAPELLRRCR